MKTSQLISSVVFIIGAVIGYFVMVARPFFDSVATAAIVNALVWCTGSLVLVAVIFLTRAEIKRARRFQMVFVNIFTHGLFMGLGTRWNFRLFEYCNTLPFDARAVVLFPAGFAAFVSCCVLLWLITVKFDWFYQKYYRLMS